MYATHNDLDTGKYGRNDSSYCSRRSTGDAERRETKQEWKTDEETESLTLLRSSTI
jgi:hypothetical protein